jgi:hypothetical protein
MQAETPTYAYSQTPASGIKIKNELRKIAIVCSSAVISLGYVSFFLGSANLDKSKGPASLVHLQKFYAS